MKIFAGLSLKDYIDINENHQCTLNEYRKYRVCLSVGNIDFTGFSENQCKFRLSPTKLQESKMSKIWNGICCYHLRQTEQSRGHVSIVKIGSKKTLYFV